MKESDLLDLKNERLGALIKSFRAFAQQEATDQIAVQLEKFMPLSAAPIPREPVDLENVRKALGF